MPSLFAFSATNWARNTLRPSSWLNLLKLLVSNSTLCRPLGFVLLAGLAVSSAGCAADDMGAGGALRVYLADSQPQLVRIEVVIDDVAVRRRPSADKPATGVATSASATDADWVLVNTSQTSPIELGGEPLSASLQLGEGPIPVGDYAAVRLHIVSAAVYDERGKRALSVGSGYVEAAHLFAYRGAGVTELRVALRAGSDPTSATADTFTPTLTVKSENRY